MRNNLHVMQPFAKNQGSCKTTEVEFQNFNQPICSALASNLVLMCVDIYVCFIS